MFSIPSLFLLLTDIYARHLRPLVEEAGIPNPTNITISENLFIIFP